MIFQIEFPGLRNPSLRGICWSARDVGGNLIAATSACPVARKIAQRNKAWGKDSFFTFTQEHQIVPLSEVSEAFLADRQILPRFGEALRLPPSLPLPS